MPPDLLRLVEERDRLKSAGTPGTPAPETTATRPATPRRVLCLVDVTDTGPEPDRLAEYTALARRHGFGLDDAARIADRLQVRDMLCLDLAMCVECSRLEGRRCGAARAGQMTSASRQFEPVRAELIRCEWFKPAGGA
ncbi:hypothetical protein [Sphaerotilus sp.]|uniref:hypothetical protein n=1 Tax=Sphaerotilus sp. TaxID=2093942 RepID=UPI0034E2B5D9